MNCEVAQLEIRQLRWDQDPPATSSSLRDHLDHCATCQAEVAEWRTFDRQIVAELRRPVPGENQPLPQVASRNRRWSRTSLWFSAAGLGLVATLVLAVMIWQRHPLPELNLELAVQQVEQLESLSGMPQFHGPVVPGHSPVFENACDPKLSNPRGLDLDGRRGHDIALYNFSIPTRGKATTGFLLVLDGTRVTENLPTSPRSSYGTVLAWREGNSVFICVVHTGDPSEIRKLWRGTTA